MDFLIQIILPYILLYKYWALFSLTFLASLALPIPAGTLLIAASAFASQGYLNITTILLIVFLANVLGDNLSYLIVRLYGRKYLSKIRIIKKIINSRNFKLIEKSITAKPGFLIIISRFEVLSTLAINLLCGLSQIKYQKFLKYEIIGSVLNVLFYVSLGYSFGDSWPVVNKLIGDFSLLFFAAIALSISIFGKKIINRLSQNIEPEVGKI